MASIPGQGGTRMSMVCYGIPECQTIMDVITGSQDDVSCSAVVRNGTPQRAKVSVRPTATA